jgi:hypothetical protein
MGQCLYKCALNLIYMTRVLRFIEEKIQISEVRSEKARDILQRDTSCDTKLPLMWIIRLLYAIMSHGGTYKRKATFGDE